MKVRVYLRVAKSKRAPFYRVVASNAPNPEPLTRQTYPQPTPLPTAAFAIDLDIPDAEFKRVEQVMAELEIEHVEACVGAEAVTE